ncbi:hypothetical protein OG413_34640 [Streptomyces sp. NBC_01433]|uniref:hypothetical protein n=1 Tax=Streptomyces sp. NBC_01433 TaxID=2903864 RepID=UPI002253B6AF|nr:hypothetical protein [Streptomyces sp. NBC_01433]MCX4680356.1 hypothetical protein [Streptomyces sp. NBC_01433]
MRSPRHAATGLCLLVALTALTACSVEPAPDDKAPRPSHGSADRPGNPSAAPVPPADTTTLKPSVRAYVKAYYAPDADAGYALLSTRCQQEWARESFAVLTERAARTAEELGRTYALRRLAVDRVQGTTAEVTYGVGDPEFDTRAEPWVHEGGEWRNDLC